MSTLFMNATINLLSVFNKSFLFLVKLNKYKNKFMLPFLVTYYIAFGDE